MSYLNRRNETAACAPRLLAGTFASGDENETVAQDMRGGAWIGCGAFDRDGKLVRAVLPDLGLQVRPWRALVLI
jgi:hypothetical protein